MGTLGFFSHSAFETSFGAFSWNDIEYKRIDSYLGTLNPGSLILS